MTGKKVLLIDDNETTINTYSRLLRDEGFWVATAKSGMRALEEFCHYSFDLVITDLTMNDGKGFTVLGVIKSLSPHIPVIAFTNERFETNRKLVSLLGTYSLIEKPSRNEIITCSTCLLNTKIHTQIQCNTRRGCQNLINCSYRHVI